MHLRPCPFCGADAELKKYNTYFWIVKCGAEDSCCEIKPNQKESEVVRKWNKRRRLKLPPKDFVKRTEALYDADSIMNALETVSRMSKLWKEKYGTK